MKRWKHFVGIFLSAVLVFLLAACNETMTWKNSETRTYLTGQGLSANHVSMLAELKVGAETTWISYAVDGAKECMVFYEDAGQTPLQVICKYNNTYYVGVPGENAEQPMIWTAGSRIEREAFSGGKAVLRLPADTDTIGAFQSQKMENGTCQEIAVLDDTQYVYLLNANGTLTGLQTQYGNEGYTVTFHRLQAPAASDFPKPENLTE